MPNGIDWKKDELEKYTAPISKIDLILADFAKRYKEKVYASSYHGYLSREISFVTRNKLNNYKLKKSIYLILKEKKWPPVYHLVVIVSNSYGIKEFLRLIPIFTKRCNYWKRLRWEKTLYEFEGSIDVDKLRQGLEEAKNILDAFAKF